jgi:cysteine sulfinate desulfinase/cysteine desulfurase-like protein
MGVAESESLASLRVSFGITNTREEVDAFLGVLGAEVQALREISSRAA